MPNSYICAQCFNIFEKGWTDEEAMTEKQEIFKSMPMKDMVVVCEDCYVKIMEFHTKQPQPGSCGSPKEAV